MLKKIVFCFLYVLFIALASGCYRSQARIDATSTPMKVVVSPSMAAVIETTITPEPSKSPVLPTRPSDTSAPTSTLTLTATNQPIKIIGVIAVNSIDAGGFLIDLATGKPKQLLINELETDILAWKSGCEGLYVETKEGDVILVDINANVIKEYYSKVHASNLNQLFPVPNPTGNWLAYQLGEGQQTYSGYEKQNLEVISIDNQDVPVRLSLAGGVWVKSWSPKGSYLAFSDFDQNSVHQVYIWNVKDRQKWQITTFTDSSIQINEISWSSDEQTLAIAYKDASNTATIKLLSVDPVIKVYPQADLVFDMVRDVWWLNKDSFIAHVLPKNAPSNSSENEELVWFDSSGTELGKFPASEISQGITFSGPLDGEVIGIFSNADFFTYDFVTKNLSMRFSGYVNIANWVRPFVSCE